MSEEISEKIKKPSIKKYYDDVNLGKRTKQVVYLCEEVDKPAMLEVYFEVSDKKQTAIVVKSKRRADELSTYLNSKDVKAMAIHGNHRKEKVEELSSAFNAGEINILITTDKILQFLGLKNLECIINYDLPYEYENYFNRLLLVDEVGESISFVSPQDEDALSIIQMRQKNDIPQEVLEGFESLTQDKVTHVTKEKKNKTRHRNRKTRKDAKSEDKEEE